MATQRVGVSSQNEFVLDTAALERRRAPTAVVAAAAAAQWSEDDMTPAAKRARCAVQELGESLTDALMLLLITRITWWASWHWQYGGCTALCLNMLRHQQLQDVSITVHKSSFVWGFWSASSLQQVSGKKVFIPDR